MTRIGNPTPNRTPLAFLPFRDVLTWDAGMSVTGSGNAVDWTMTLTRKEANYHQSRTSLPPRSYIILSQAHQDRRRHTLQLPVYTLTL